MVKNLISVIVPVYNCEKYVSKCLESIINQTYSKIEIILVNDGSTDNTIKICEKYLNKDSRIKLYQKKNTGVSAARNLGLSVAKGEYITFCDSDDYLEPEAYEKMINAIWESKSELVIMNYNVIKNEKKYRKDFGNIVENKLDRRRFLYCMSEKTFRGFVWNKLYKKSILDDLKFDIDIYICEDMLFNVMYALNINNAIYINDNLYNYVVRENSACTTSFNKKFYTELEAYDRIINLLNDKFENIDLKYKEAYLETAIRIMRKYKEAKCDDKNEKQIIDRAIKKYYYEVLKSNQISIRRKLYLIAYKWYSELI